MIAYKSLAAIILLCLSCSFSQASEEGVLNSYKVDIAAMPSATDAPAVCLMLNTKYNAIGRNFKYEYDSFSHTINYYVFSGAGNKMDYYKLFLTIPYEMK